MAEEDQEKGKEYSVWRFGKDIRIYSVRAKDEQQARDLVEKYPYLDHQVISENSDFGDNDEVTYRVVKVAETKQELLDMIFGRKGIRKKSGKKE